MLIKMLPEDFVVEEIGLHDIGAEGDYVLLELKKHGMTTEDAVAVLTNQLGVSRRTVAYAGTKDAHAVTTQYMTIRSPRGFLDKLKRFSHKKAGITILGRRSEPLSLGMLSKNKFTIMCRKLSVEKIEKRAFIPNYFDEQRFSTANAAIGKHIVGKEFGAAVKLVVKTDKQFADKIVRHLSERPNDYVSALRLLPRHTLLMYVHAYQSLLFNEVLTKYIETNDKNAELIRGPVPLAIPDKQLGNVQIPLIGFGTELEEPFRGWYDEILQREKLSQRDFVVRAIPFLTVEGTERDAFCTVEDLVVGDRTPDDMHPHYEKQQISFTLQKASYATIVIKCLYRTGTIR